MGFPMGGFTGKQVLSVTDKRDDGFALRASSWEAGSSVTGRGFPGCVSPAPGSPGASVLSLGVLSFPETLSWSLSVPKQ